LPYYQEIPRAACPVCRVAFQNRVSPGEFDLAVCSQCASLLVLASHAPPRAAGREEVARLTEAQRAKLEELQRHLLGVRAKARAAHAGGRN
jgi:hypothetical protein